MYANLFEDNVRVLSLKRFEDQLDRSVTTTSLSILSVTLLIDFFVNLISVTSLNTS